MPDGDRTRVAVRGEPALDAGQELRPALRRTLYRSADGIDLDLRSSSPAVERPLDLTGSRDLLPTPTRTAKT
ncbi:hypothetical protein ABT381_28145 [Streptomyces sp. NPDC000151]|uniref:hypothetical protein n=1 Tax=Streptomyces sp. NPDC000151 TaxID=3154244 RepID=UPI00331ABE03